MQQWVYEGDRGRCVRHPGETFSRVTSCAKCWDDPGPLEDEADVVVPAPVPAGCRSTDDHERRLLALGDRLADAGAEMIESANEGDTERGPDYHRANTGAKLVDTALKAYRAALGLASTREAEFVVRGHVREMRKLRAGVPH